jgi:thioredoxin reductase
MSNGSSDVAVVGAGAAGLSACTALGRFGLSVVAVDDAHPRNAPAAGVHNVLTRDGTPPAELYRLGRSEAAGYGVRFVDGTVTEIRGSIDAFTLDLGDQTIAARRVLVATGARDELPDVPGVAERWGRDVVHCPFCSGYEVRGRRIGVLATDPMAAHHAMMFRLLSPFVTVLGHTAPPGIERTTRLAERGIGVVAGVVERLVVDDDRLTAVRLTDGSHVELDALVVSTVVHARADLLAALGLHPTDLALDGHRFGTRIEADANGVTAVPGVLVAGNTANPMAHVQPSAASGLAAAMAIIGDLVAAPR